MCKTNLQKKQQNKKNLALTNVEKVSVQQLNENISFILAVILGLRIEFVEESEKQLSDLFPQISYYIILFERINTLTLS